LLIALFIVMGIVAYLASNPHLVAPFASRLISRNLLRDFDGNLRIRDFRLHYLQGVDLYDVSVALQGSGGGVTLISADTLAVEYRLGEVFSRHPRIRAAVIKGGEVYASAGSGPPRLREPSFGWPTLQIDRLEIQDASLEFSGADGRLRERIPVLSWRGVVRADTALTVELRDADVQWETRDIHLSRVFGEVEVSAHAVRARELHLRLNDSEVLVSGSRTWQGELDITVRGSDLKVTEVEDLTGVALDFACTGDLQATIQSEGDSLLFDGLFTGELEGYQMDRVRGRAIIMPDAIDWYELEGTVNAAYFAGQMQIDLSQPGSTSFVLQGAVSDVDLSQRLVPDETLPASDGSGQVTIFHRDDPEQTRVTGSLRDGFYAIFPFDSTYVDVEVIQDRVIYHQIDMFHRGQAARLTGEADSSRFFVGHLELDVPNLSRLPDQWHLPPLTGVLTGAGRLAGHDSNLTFSGKLAVREATLHPLRIGPSEVDLVVNDVLGVPRIGLTAQGENLRTGTVPLGDYQLSGGFTAGAARLSDFRTVRGDTVVNLSGRADFSDTSTVINVNSLGIDLEQNRWRMTDQTVLRVDRTGVRLPQFKLTSEYGSMTVLDLDTTGDSYSGTLELANFDLGLLNPFLPDTTQLAGHATAAVHLSGRKPHPLVSLEAQLADIPLDLAHIAALQVTGQYSQGRTQIDRLVLETDHGRVQAFGSISHPGVALNQFWPDATLDLDLQVREADWAFIDQFAVPALDRISGQYEADLHVAGTTREPLITGTVISEPFHIHWLHLDRLTGQVRVEKDQMILADLAGSKWGLEATGRIELPLQFSLLSQPDTPLDGPLLMRFAIPEVSDLGPLAQATNAFIESSGTGSAEVTIAGPLERPQWSGSLWVRDAGFVLKRMGEIYRNVSCEGTFRGNELLLSNIRGEEGARGTFSGSGSVTFRGLELETFAINLAADRFLVASIPDLRVLVKGQDFLLSGLKVGPDSLLVPKFTGNLEVIEGRYTGNFAERAGASDPLAATIAPDWLADVQIFAPPRSMRIVNRAMELYMSGDVNLIRDLDGMYLRGSMTIDAGRFPVFNNDFKVVSGTLDFSRAVGVIPRANLTAETRVRVRDPGGGGSRQERIEVSVTGLITEPEITFSSESGYSREGIERMLLGLSPYATDPQGVGGLRGATIAAGFNLLEREIALGLNVIDTFDIEQVERRQEDGTATLSPLIGVGKYLGQDLYIKYAQGLAQDERDLVVEYQITNYLLLQSAMRRRIDELQGDTSYSLDLKYRFEY
jgi:hypothetical protein